MSFIDEVREMRDEYAPEMSVREKTYFRDIIRSAARKGKSSARVYLGTRGEQEEDVARRWLEEEGFGVEVWVDAQDGGTRWFIISF